VYRSAGSSEFLQLSHRVCHSHRDRCLLLFGGRDSEVPLLLVTIWLFTDEGRFFGLGEEYSVKAALDEAADLAEKNALRNRSREMNLCNRPNSPERREEPECLLS